MERTYFFQKQMYGCDDIALKTQMILMNGLPSKLLSVNIPCFQINTSSLYTELIVIFIFINFLIQHLIESNKESKEIVNKKCTALLASFNSNNTDVFNCVYPKFLSRAFHEDQQ